MYQLLQHLPNGETQIFFLDPLPVLAGRGKGLGLVIAHPSVSREHARFFESDRRLHVADLNSSNGTFVNGNRVSLAALNEGDEIRLGAATYTLAQEGAAPEVEEIALPRPEVKAAPPPPPVVPRSPADIKIKKDLLQYHKIDARTNRSFLRNEFSQYGSGARLLIVVFFLVIAAGVFVLFQWAGSALAPEEPEAELHGFAVEEEEGN